MLAETASLPPAASTPVSRLYAAFANRDVDGLLGALHPEFVGQVTAGMPLGVGGAHHGPDAMMDVWFRVFGAYDVIPVPTEIWLGDDRTVIVHGWYRGTHRSTDTEVSAEFVHLLDIDDGTVRGLRQITDTASWTPA